MGFRHTSMINPSGMVVCSCRQLLKPALHSAVWRVNNWSPVKLSKRGKKTTWCWIHSVDSRDETRMQGVSLSSVAFFFVVVFGFFWGFFFLFVFLVFFSLQFSPLAFFSPKRCTRKFGRAFLRGSNSVTVHLTHRVNPCGCLSVKIRVNYWRCEPLGKGAFSSTTWEIFYRRGKSVLLFFLRFFTFYVLFFFFFIGRKYIKTVWTQLPSST